MDYVEISAGGARVAGRSSSWRQKILRPRKQTEGEQVVLVQRQIVVDNSVSTCNMAYSLFRMSDEMRERIAAIIEFSRVTLHYTYIPLIVYLGYTRSNPKPDLLRYWNKTPEATVL